MKKLHLVLMMLFITSFCFAQNNNSNQPTNSEIMYTFKEVLNSGLNGSVTSLGKPNGYFGSADHKIHINNDMRKITGLVTLLPAFKNLDSVLYLKMNQAAEQATPNIKSLIKNKIVSMSIPNPMTILMQNDTACTYSLKSEAYSQIYNQFSTFIDQSLNSSGANQYWALVTSTYVKQPNASNVPVPLLKNVVTKQALDIIFNMLADEEKMIRHFPYSRTNNQMKKVFKMQDAK
jgi:Protein of unknown function (DUF4197)